MSREVVYVVRVQGLTKAQYEKLQAYATKKGLTTPEAAAELFKKALKNVR